MIVIKNKLIPFGSYTSINLFGIVFTKEDMTEKSINHERIHSVQLFEIALVAAIIIGLIVYLANASYWWMLMSLPVYYVWYCCEYMWISVMHDKQICAYKDISFEEEAHANDDDLNYIRTRKPFAWFKYTECESNHKSKDRDCCN